MPCSEVGFSEMTEAHCRGNSLPVGPAQIAHPEPEAKEEGSGFLFFFFFLERQAGQTQSTPPVSWQLWYAWSCA